VHGGKPTAQVSLREESSRYSHKGGNASLRRAQSGQEEARRKEKKRNESGVKSSARIKGKRKGSKAERLINQLRNSKSSLRMALRPDRDVQTGELARCMQ